MRLPHGGWRSITTRRPAGRWRPRIARFIRRSGRTCWRSYPRRPAFAGALLDQIAAGKVPRQDLGAFHARQIRSLGDPGLTERLSQVWGVLRESDSDRRQRALRSRSSSMRRRCTGPISVAVGPSLIAFAPRATNCMDPAATSGRISAAPAGITLTICWKTSSTPAPPSAPIFGWSLWP